MSLIDLTPDEEARVMEIIDGPLDTFRAAELVAQVAGGAAGDYRGFIAFSRARAEREAVAAAAAGE